MKTFIIFFIVIHYTSHIATAQAKLYFSKKKISDLSKVESNTNFLPGDTIYGLLHIIKESGGYNKKLDNYTIEENGQKVVPIYLGDIKGGEIPLSSGYFTSDVLISKVTLSSGIIEQKKKSSLSKLLKKASGMVVYGNNTNDTSLEPEAFYFQVIPVKRQEFTMEWMKWFTLISRSPKAPKQITLTVGTSSENIRSNFIIDLTNGTGPYAVWGKPYLEEENRLRVEKEMQAEEKRKKQQAEYYARMKETLDASDKIPLPVAKIKDPKLEKELFNFLKEYYKDMAIIYKVYITDAESSSEFWVSSLAKEVKSEQCFIYSEAIYRENPYKDYYKYRRAGLVREMIKCERLSGAIKK